MENQFSWPAIFLANFFRAQLSHLLCFRSCFDFSFYFCLFLFAYYALNFTPLCFYFYTAKLGNIFCTLPNFAIPFLSTSYFLLYFFFVSFHSHRKKSPTFDPLAKIALFQQWRHGKEDEFDEPTLFFKIFRRKKSQKLHTEHEDDY